MWRVLYEQHSQPQHSPRWSPSALVWKLSFVLSPSVSSLTSAPSRMTGRPNTDRLIVQHLSGSDRSMLPLGTAHLGPRPTGSPPVRVPPLTDCPTPATG